MSSAASISAAKRRRGPQPTFTGQAQSKQSPGQEPERPSQGPVRITPMSILESHERRLRVIEGSSTNSTQDERVETLLKENEELNNSLVSLNKKIVELLKVKDMVINMQSSVLSNAQKVETLNSDIKSLKTDNEWVVSTGVGQELEDVTANMTNATIKYGEVTDTNETVTI